MTPDHAVLFIIARGETAGLKAPAFPVRVHFGSCIATGRRFRRQAHAHTEPRSSHRGWICILSAKPERAVSASGRPTRLLIHEVAHMFAPSDWHGERWQRAVTLLGAPSEVTMYKEVVAARTRR